MGKFNEYSQKATPEDADSLMIYDAAAKANKLSPFSGIWNWIVGKLTNAVISNLQTSNQTVLGAINELNSKASGFDGNIKKVGFRSGQRALNNIYLDFYDSNNSRTSLAFTTDGENAIKFLANDEEKWKFDSNSFLRYERTYGKSLTIKNVRAATHGLIMIEKTMVAFYLGGSTSAGYTVVTSALPDGITVSNSGRSVTIKSTRDQIITCFYAFL